MSTANTRPQLLRNLPALLIFLILTCASCRENPPPGPGASPAPVLRDVPAVHDYVAHPQVDAMERDAHAPSMVSISPQLTEIACALGLRSALVGRSSYCNHPPGIESVPSVGDLRSLNLEILLELKPDLVLISGQSDLIRNRLDGIGITYVSLPDSSLEDVYLAIQSLGELTSRSRTARNLIRAIQDDVQRLTRDYPPASSKSVLVLTGMGMQNPPQAPWVAGPDSYLDALLRMAGHQNAADGLKRPYGQIALEEILSRNPDVILEFVSQEQADPQAYARAYENWSKIGAIKAVQEGNLRMIPGQLHLVPGPRVALTLREIIRNVPN